jgi:hypothetical protein
MSKRIGRFREEFFMEPGNAMGCFIIRTQKLHIGKHEGNSTSQVSTLAKNAAPCMALLHITGWHCSLFLIL